MRTTLTLLLAALTLAACGSDDTALDWPRTDDPIGATGGLVWADASTGEVHLAGGTTLDAGRPISSFVVAGQGAYAIDKTDRSLLEVTPDGARDTGAQIDGGLKASADGRYLAFIDPQSGPAVQGAHVLEAVVVDLETGREVARSTQGMGGKDTDDLVDLYEDASHGVLAVSDATAWFSVPEGGVLAVDLASGRTSRSPVGDISDAKNPWVGPRFAPEPADGPANPARTWGIDHVNTAIPGLSDDPVVDFPRDRIVSPGGDPVTLRIDAVSWRFQAWIDDTTVVGYANEGLDNPDRVETTMDRSLVTCTVPAGTCALVPESTRAILPVPSLY